MIVTFEPVPEPLTVTAPSNKDCDDSNFTILSVCALSVVAFEALKAVTLAALALNEVATEELKLPVTLATLALNADTLYALALNEVAALAEYAEADAKALAALAEAAVMFVVCVLSVNALDALKAFKLAALALNEVAALAE